MPGNIEIGTSSAVAAKAHELEGKPLVYTWKVTTPGIGTFTPVTGATSTFACIGHKVGETMTVTANNGECSKSLSTTVSCIDTFCGNGVVEPGENCDTAIPNVPCPADCTYVCGDGVAEAPVEDCDPPNTANCAAGCKTRAPLCNDGFRTNGEICDPSVVPSGAPLGKLCRADCSGFNDPVAANQGTVALAFHAPVVAVNSVHYSIIDSATPPTTIRDGDLPTPGTASNFNFDLSLPAGTGYRIALNANAAASGVSIICSVGYVPFSVTSNSSVNLTVALTCTEYVINQLITGSTDACPKLLVDYVAATPGATVVGSNIALGAKARDVDGKAVTYAWRVADPTTGTFSSTTGANPSVTCDRVKSGEILTMTASNGVCSKSLSITVSCSTSQ
jgi:hypothetical protein